MSSILWYLHDHGRGHLERARAVLPHVGAPVVVAAGPGIASLAERVLGTEVVALPSDVPSEPTATIGPWHHAPSGTTLRRRTTALLDVIEDHDCSTAVVDLSAEVTVLARLAGLRTIALRQSGRRTDVAHCVALDSADIVWVPQDRPLEPLDGPTDERWFFSGSFSRLDATCRGRRPRSNGGIRHCVVLIGSGGTNFDAAPWRGVHPPDGWRITILGAGDPWSCGGVRCLGHVPSVEEHLATADVAITSAGWAAVADAVACGCRLVVVPEDRPFDEQRTRAEALAAAGLAIARPAWPLFDELADVLEAATRLDPRAWCRHHDGHGAQRSAAMIEQVHRG